MINEKLTIINRLDAILKRYQTPFRFTIIRILEQKLNEMDDKEFLRILNQLKDSLSKMSNDELMQVVFMMLNDPEAKKGMAETGISLEQINQLFNDSDFNNLIISLLREIFDDNKSDE